MAQKNIPPIIDRNQLSKEAVLVTRDPANNEVISIISAGDLQIGINDPGYPTKGLRLFPLVAPRDFKNKLYNENGVLTFDGDPIASGTYVTGALKQIDISADGGTASGDATLTFDATTGVLSLKAGSNVTLTGDASNRAITITAAGGGGAGGSSFFSSTTEGSIFTTGSTAFVGGQTSPAMPDAPNDVGADVFFFVSGTIGSKDTTTTGSSVFGGDTVISGTLFAGGSNFHALVGSTVGGTISGSIHHTSGGLSYLIGGSGISVASGTNGQITITNDGTVGDITEVIAGTGLTGGGSSGAVTLNINDSVVATLTGSLFSGNVGITGSLQVGALGTGADVTFYGEDSDAVGLQWDADSDEHGKLILGQDNHGVNFQVYGESSNNYINWDQSADTFYIYVPNGNLYTKGDMVFDISSQGWDFTVNSNSRVGIFIDGDQDQIYILSGGTGTGPTSPNPANASDLAFFVSGTVGSKDSSTKGTAVFGGDIAVSGTLVANRSDDGAYAAIKIDKDYTGTTNVGSFVGAGTDPSGLFVDYDVTGIVASGQEAYHDAIAVNYNQDGAVHVGTINATGADIRMTGGTDGTQAMKGVAVKLTGASTNTGIDIEVPDGETHFIARSSTSVTDYFKLSVTAAGLTTLTTNDGSSDAAHLNIVPDGKVLILSGGAAGSADESAYTDTNFFISGTIGSKNSSTKGTSVFGGDVHVSGNLTIDGTAGGIVNGSGAATRLAYWSNSNTLTSDADLNFNGSNLGLTGSAVGVNSALDVDRNYAGTTSNSSLTSHAGASGILIDYDVTGIVASGQYQKHKGLWIKYDQSVPTHVGMVQGCGLQIEMTGSDVGLSQTIDGIRIDLADHGTFSNSAARGISVTAPAGWVEGEVNASHIRCHDLSTTSYFDISVGTAGISQITTLDSSAANAHLNLKPDGKMLILSGGAVTSVDESTYADTCFFVSGTVGSRGTAVAGTSVFGGDVVVSGSVLPGLDSTVDLGSSTNRFANVYTGDLHLKNEKGDWTILEERDVLIVVNNITGKKYEMMLKPID